MFVHSKEPPLILDTDTVYVGLVCTAMILQPSELQPKDIKYFVAY